MTPKSFLRCSTGGVKCGQGGVWVRSGKGVCLPRDDHSGRLFQLKPPDFGLPIPKSTRFRAKGLTALVRQSQNMLFTQLLQFCWHRFRCQTVQPHCHLIHGPRFNLVARVRRGPAAAGRHSRTDPVRLACLGPGRAPRGEAADLLPKCATSVPTRRVAMCGPQLSAGLHLRDAGLSLLCTRRGTSM